MKVDSERRGRWKRILPWYQTPVYIAVRYVAGICGRGVFFFSTGGSDGLENEGGGEKKILPSDVISPNRFLVGP